jgi:hypothetical protein
MIRNFSLRSLLGMVAFICVVLCAVSVSIVARSPEPDGSVLFYLRCVAIIPLVFGGLTFWLVLLMPTWIPLFFMTAEARNRQGVRPFLAIIPAVWYCALYVLTRVVMMGYLHPVLNCLLQAGAVIGTLLAIVALVASSGRRRYVLIVPLGIAIISGTVSILFARA